MSWYLGVFLKWFCQMFQSLFLLFAFRVRLIFFFSIQTFKAKNSVLSIYSCCTWLPQTHFKFFFSGFFLPMIDFPHTKLTRNK